MNYGSITLARNDRHVLRGRLRVRAGAPAHTLIFNVEEALRLCSLPGENEGRAYYFRHLSVAGLPADGDRHAWLEAFERALLELARYAVHGKEIAAGHAEAVYFFNEQEACESLLALILKRQPVGRLANDAWFWPAISGSEPGASAAVQITRVIEKLSRSEASWMAVAAAVLTATDRDPISPLSLLRLLPDHTARQWLYELAGYEEAPPLTRVPVGVPETTRSVIARAAALLGHEDPRVVWLASLAVILACPSEMDSGTAVHSARLILRTILMRDLPHGLDHDVTGQIHLSSAQVALREAPPNRRSQTDTDVIAETTPASNDDSPGPVPDVPGIAPSRAQQNPYIRQTHAPHARRSEKTQGAGLYFLLNALHHLGIADREFNPPFLAHLFQGIARHAGIAEADPILLWTLAALDENGPWEIDERLLRIWVWKVRRWCWRNGKITIREIVRRPGLVTLTRTDLDISLPLDSVDIRIRRIGLDLDPGWLPWFGRVVRFHYLSRGEFQ